MNNKIFDAKNTWLEITYQALTNLNGYGKLESIYNEVFKIDPNKCINNKNWKPKVRQTIQRWSSDSTTFKPNSKDLFISLEGIGGGAWGIRGLMEESTQYDKVIETIKQMELYGIDQWQLGPKVNVLNSLLEQKARKNFRKKVLESRNLKSSKNYSDIEKINVSEYNLDMKLDFIEAAHIIDVSCIKKTIQNIVSKHEINDLVNKQEFNNLLNTLSDSSNALLLPFNYHKIFDLNLIWFNEETGFMHFNDDFQDDFAKLGIYPAKLKENIMDNKKILKNISIRNKYRKKMLNDIWNLFQDEYNNSLNV